MTPKELNRFCLLACAPFIGMLFWFALTTLHIDISVNADRITADTDEAPAIVVPESSKAISEGLDHAKKLANQTIGSIRKVSELYKKTTSSMNSIMTTASTQAPRPGMIYDRRITSKLGAVSRQVNTDKINAELFYLHEQNYKGYALKVKLKSPKAMDMVLGYDKLGAAETTLSAVKRYGAVAGVNAGGFADEKGKRYPLSTTIVNGKLVGDFEPSYKDLFFVGLNDNGKLIGGKFGRKNDLVELNPKFGASFVPVLLKNGLKTTIPPKWETSPRRAPRTVVGNYKDDQLLFIVTDGYTEDGSSGASLEELQNALVRLGVKDAYNLDGGGSSTLVFQGKVVNKPSDGRLRPLATHFLFFK